MLRLSEMRTVSCVRCNKPALSYVLGKSGPICINCKEDSFSFKAWRLLEYSTPWLLLFSIVCLLFTLVVEMLYK